jgi:3-oxoacyl-[acyl-carrier-protein] synthase III
MQDTGHSTFRGAELAIGLKGIAYFVGESVPIDELSCLANDAGLLERFKNQYFKNFSRSGISRPEQAALAAKETLRKCNMQAGDIDAVVIGFSELREWADYPEQLTRAILSRLGMNRIPVAGVTLSGCANAASALRAARNMVIAEGYRNVLVIETNLLQDDDRRLLGTEPGVTPENVFGDGAVSFVVTSDIDTADFDLLAVNQIVSFAEGEKITMQDELVVSTNGARHVIDRVLDHAGLAREQINCLLLNNMNFKIMAALMHMYGFSKVDFFIENALNYGHVWSADPFMNLNDYCKKKAPPNGTLFMLVTYGRNNYVALICRKRQSANDVRQAE